MAGQTPVLLLGATGMSLKRCHPQWLHFKTGYIGGAVLSKLLAERQSTSITALVRNAEKATILQSKFGVKAVVGTHQELDKVERLAEDAQIVFNLVIPYPTSQRECDTESPCQADADDELLIKAILSGAKTRQALVGESSVLIHTGSTIVRSLLVYTKLILCRPCSPAPTL